MKSVRNNDAVSTTNSREEVSLEDCLSVGDDGESHLSSSKSESSHAATPAYSTREDVLRALTAKESKRINQLRILLGLILVGATFGAAYTIFRVTRTSEEIQFRTIFRSLAFKITNSFESHVRTTIGAMDNFALVMATTTSKTTTTSSTSTSSSTTTTTSYGTSQINDWPFVTSPKFEIRGASSRTLAGAAVLSVVPLVQQENVTQWEIYTVENSGWVDDGLNFDTGIADESGAYRQVVIPPDGNGGGTRNLLASANISDKIFQIDFSTGLAVDDDSDGPSLPVWQTNPVQPQVVNYNIRSHPSFGEDAEFLKDSSKIVFGRVADLSNPADPYHFLYHDIDSDGSNDGAATTVEDDTSGSGQRLLLRPGRDLNEESDVGDNGSAIVTVPTSNNDGNIDYGDPVSMTFFPIFDQIDEPRQLVGMLSSAIYWRDYLFGALSERDTQEPILAVLENTCGQVFTYEIKGETVEVMGEGDYHSDQFDYLETVFDMNNIATELGDTEALTFSGVGLYTDGCAFTLRVYPTTEMEKSFYSWRPVSFAFMMTFAFLFATIVFFLYDVVVQRRQRKISNKAKQTMGVVNSLFPENVRDRLFDQQDHESRMLAHQRAEEAAGAGGTGPHKASVHDGYANDVSSSANQVYRRHSQSKRAGKRTKPLLPIADLFPEATVLFADIAGFTAWSSAREPTQVFTLLEAIYSVLDSLARRRKVFKVETIGDCYLAVTGIPEPQADHAVIMAKFAMSGLQRVSNLTRDLEMTLGPDTGNLKLRFGLHSGPVTAGVLRGEKSRFQLFGDTVNTASRMESTGTAEKIQCSEATAEKLFEANKGDWLSKREDKVHAKGKGEVQTYWIHPPLSSNTSSSGDSLGDSFITPVPVPATPVFSEQSLVVTNHKDMAKTASAAAAAAAAGPPPPQPPISVSSGGTRQRRLARNFSIFLREIESSEQYAQGTWDDKMHRLVEWNVDLFSKLLKTIYISRDPATTARGSRRSSGLNLPNIMFKPTTTTNAFSADEKLAATPMDDLVDEIKIPYGGEKKMRMLSRMASTKTVGSGSGAMDTTGRGGGELPDIVVGQLRSYITAIAKMYRENPFHNFAHSSHVCLSAQKLLSRIIDPTAVSQRTPIHQQQQQQQKLKQDRSYRQSLNGGDNDDGSYAFGLSEDPLTHFAIIFSALIHDVDHCGISNKQLVREGVEIATMYNNRSVLEQNSIDVAWELLMEDQYEDLRQCIYTNQEEYDHFRHVVVNAVMATDIFDTELKAHRDRRWKKAFETTTTTTTTATTATINDNLFKDDLKATLVIELLMQTSDVCHTMQHWHVFTKWNENLFHEMYTAYLSNRVDTNYDGTNENDDDDEDPSKNWYETELQFFDTFILPLATKMKGFGVFGVSGYEYMNYAKENRKEWEVHGRELITKWKVKHKQQYHNQLLQQQQHQQELNKNSINNINQALLEMKLDEIEEEDD